MLFDYRVGGVQKGQNIDYVIFERSLMISFSKGKKNQTFKFVLLKQLNLFFSHDWYSLCIQID